MPEDWHIPLILMLLQEFRIKWMRDTVQGRFHRCLCTKDVVAQLSVVMDDGGRGGFLGTKLLSVAVNYQCCIAPPFQEYLFCLFMVMVSCRYRAFDPTLSPSSVSVTLHIN